MLPRKILPTLRARLHAYPAAALVGPRQCKNRKKLRTFLPHRDNEAFLVRRLPPYSANIRKRVIKRPKLYCAIRAFSMPC